MLGLEVEGQAMEAINPKEIKPLISSAAVSAWGMVFVFGALWVIGSFILSFALFDKSSTKLIYLSGLGIFSYCIYAYYYGSKMNVFRPILDFANKHNRIK